MRFTPLASSSRGNAYLLQSDGVAPLLLEAGIPIKQLREKLRDHGVMLSDLAGCLVSHEHMDHAKAVKDLLKAGVDCYMSQGTAVMLKTLEHHRSHIASMFNVPPGWQLIPFHLEHDATEPVGFFISHGNNNLLFVPDTAFVTNTFHGITLAAIECNNIAEIMSKNILEGNIPAVVGRRIRRNHMNLETLIQFLKANDLSRCREIYLMHLSDGNSDEREMVRKVQQATGIPTEAC